MKRWLLAVMAALGVLAAGISPAGAQVDESRSGSESLDRTSDDDGESEDDDESDDDESDDNDTENGLDAGEAGSIAISDEILDAGPPIEWGECDIPLQPGSPPVPSNYQCALYPVPLDWSDPDNGETVDIALIRRPAGPPGTVRTDPDETAPLGSLFNHPGGPSGSGVEFVLSAGEFVYAPEVLNSYDLIGFDSRFTGYSEGLRCFDGTEDRDRFFSDDFQYPETRAEIRLQDRLNRNVERICKRNADRGRDFMSSTDVAHDLARLHRVVGDPSLNLVGYSYGTVLVSMFSNIYPDRVGAMIADAVIDPVAYITGYSEDNPPPTGEASERDRDVPAWHRFNDGSSRLYIANEFFRLCDEAGPELCAFAPDASERFDALLAAVDERPAVISPDLVVDDTLLAGFVAGELYSTTAMPSLAQSLAFIETVVARQVDSSSSAAFARSAEAGALVQKLEELDTSVPFPVNVNGIEQYWGVICSDAKDPDDIRAWVDAADDPFGPWGPAWAWADRACEDWTGLDRNRFEGPWNTETANPVLVASTTYDPATPFEGARVLSDLLPNSTLLTVEGWSHTTALLSLCAIELQTSYLLTRELPGGEVICQQDVLPFGVPAAATPVDRYGVPIDEDPQVLVDSSPAGQEVVDTEAEVRAIAAEERVPDELLVEATLADLAGRGLTEDEVGQAVQAAAAAEALQRATAHSTRSFNVQP